jgi:hypothetical protein
MKHPYIFSSLQGSLIGKQSCGKAREKELIINNLYSLSR